MSIMRGRSATLGGFVSRFVILENVGNHAFDVRVQFRFDGPALLGWDSQRAIPQATSPFRAFQHDTAHSHAEIAFVTLPAKGPPCERPTADRVFNMIPAASCNENRAT